MEERRRLSETEIRRVERTTSNCCRVMFDAGTVVVEEETSGVGAADSSLDWGSSAAGDDAFVSASVLMMWMLLILL